MAHMRKLLVSLGVALLVTCAWSARASAADRLVLVTGGVLRGKVIKRTSESVTFRTREGMVLTLPVARIRTLTTSSGVPAYCRAITFACQKTKKGGATSSKAVAINIGAPAAPSTGIDATRAAPATSAGATGTSAPSTEAPRGQPRPCRLYPVVAARSPFLPTNLTFC